MSKNAIAMVYYLISFVVGVIAAVWFASVLAARLGWPSWVLYILVFLEVVLVLNLRRTLPNFYHSMMLHLEGFGSLLGEGIGCTLLIGVAFVIVPLIVLVWFIWIFLR